MVPTTHDSERHSHITLLRKRGNDRVQRPLSSRKRVRRRRIEAEEPAAILQRKSSPGSDNPGSKSRVIALNQGHHIPFTIYHAQISCVAPRRHLSRRTLAVSTVWINQFRSFGRPLLRKHHRHRQFLFPLLGHIFHHVRLHHFPCLHHAPPPL